MHYQLKNIMVKTKIPHVCWGCGNEYPPKTRMRYTVEADGRDFITAYWCEVCEQVMSDWYPEDCGSIGFGDVKDGDTEFWNEAKADVCM